MIAGALEIQMRAEMARLSKDLQDGKSQLGAFKRDVDKVVGEIKGVFAALGFTAGIGGLALLGKEAINTLDALGDLSKTTRIAVEDLAGLRFAARQSGADLETTASAINKLAVNMGKEGEKFRALGVTAREPIEAFKQLADVTNAIADPQQRAAVLAEALGKGWEKAAPLLAEGSKRIGEMVDEGKKLSGVSEELVKQADEFNDKLVKIAGNGAGVNTVLAQMLPLLNATADGILANGKSTTVWEAVGKGLAEVLRVVVVLAGNVAFVLRGIRDEAVGMATQLVALAHGDLKGFSAIGAQMKADAEANLKAFDEWEKSIMGVTAVVRTAIPVLDAGDQVTRRWRSESDSAARAFLAKAAAIAKVGKEAKLAGDADSHWLQWLEKLRKETLEAERALKEYERAILELNAARARDLDAINLAVEREKFANETRGLSRSAIEALVIARMEERLETMRGVEGAEAEIRALEAQIDARKRLRDAIGTTEDAERALEVQRQTAAVWSEIADRGARFFEDIAFNGKNAFDALKDMVKSFAKELIALFAKRWILNMAAGGSVVGSAAQAFAGSGAGGISGAGSLAGAVFGGASNFVAGMSLPASAVGAAAIEAGVGVGATSAAGLGSTFATAMMAIPVWGWIVAGLATIALILSRRKGGDKEEGQFITGGAPGFNIEMTSGNAAAEQLATGLAVKIAEAQRAFGLAPGAFQVGVGLVRDPRGDAQTMMDTLLRTAGGEELLRQHNASVGRSPEEEQAEFEIQAQRVILAALQASTLPTEVAEILNSIVAATATPAEIQAVVTAALEMKGILEALANIGVPGLDINALKLMQREGEKLSDTFNSVAQGMATFYELFYTEEENRARLQAQLTAEFAALGLALPSTREGLRALIEGLDLTDEAQAQLYRTLLELAPAFAELVPIAEDVAEAVDQINEVVDIAARSLLPIDFYGTIVALTEKLLGDFNTKFGGVIGGQPTKLGQLGLQATLLNEQAALYESQWAILRAKSLATGVPPTAEYYALEAAIVELRKQFKATGVDIASLTILEAQYGQEKGEQLFELQKWYEAQKALIGANLTAINALEELYGAKREEILAETLQNGVEAARGKLGQYLQSLLVNPSLSTLSPMERLAEAQRQYEAILTRARGGDIDAMSGLQGSSDAYLKIAREIFASSSGYVGIFEKVFNEIAGVAGSPGYNEQMLGLNAQLATNTAHMVTILSDVRSLLTRIADDASLTAEATEASADALTSTVTIEPR